MSFRVCIPCAGTGSRLGILTKFINKSLVSIADRPTLSHIIEQFPAEAEFVIALGHKGQLIREFLGLAYPERKFYFAEVNQFEGPGSGLGLSLHSCKDFLQQPFIFISCDTLVEETIPIPDRNWMGFSEKLDLENYRTISVLFNEVKDINEKGVTKLGDQKPYIGLAGIHDYREFWTAMEQDWKVAVDTGEAHGMRSLLANGIQAKSFTWHDTGNLESLLEVRQHYKKKDSPNILEKANEAIWFVGHNVIKYSDDKKFIANRVKRAQVLKEFVPRVTGVTENMYRYTKVKGKVLSEVATPPIFDRFLEHSAHFWKQKHLAGFELTKFRENCMKFYRAKTFERVELFYKNFDLQDGVETINGEQMPPLLSVLNAIDWDWLADGMPGRFHGDLHFENILCNTEGNNFIFLDWRQDFSGNLSVGDIYYDFAKLLHGLLVNHKVIASNRFNVEWRLGEIIFDLHRKKNLVECEQRFDTWIKRQGYDTKKVRVLTALIFLNIAALHHNPYSLLLYTLGKSMLKFELEN